MARIEALKRYIFAHSGLGASKKLDFRQLFDSFADFSFRTYSINEEYGWNGKPYTLIKIRLVAPDGTPYMLFHHQYFDGKIITHIKNLP